MLNFYRQAVALRKSLQIVRDGSYKEYYRLSDKLYVYERVLEDERLLVICSFSKKALSVKLPKSYRQKPRTLLLSNYDAGKDNEDVLRFRPYEARVYRFEEVKDNTSVR